MANTAKGYYSYAGSNVTGITFGSSPVAGLDPGQSLTKLQSTLTNSDVMSRAIAADEIAEYREYYDKTWKVRLYDAYWRETGELGDDLMELTGSDPRNNVPTCSIKIKGGSKYVHTFMGCRDTMVGVTVETGGLRMALNQRGVAASEDR